jgi:hypothetical protein
MIKYSIAAILFFALSVGVSAQSNSGGKDKKSVKETLEQLPEMLIAQPDAGPDSNANRLRNDNLSILIDPAWYDKGLQTLLEFKLTKTDYEPLYTTFPIPEKKIVQSLTINMGTPKKSANDKKNDVLNVVKKHIIAFYKESGVALSADELSNKVSAAVVGTDKLKTDEGKDAELVFINDIESKQSSFIILMTVPAANGTSTHFIQFSYTRFNYDTNLPEDIADWRTFVYPTEQQQYIDFTKNILKTLRIRQ